MPSITLGLAANSSVAHSQDLVMAQYVQKRIEHFRYTKTVVDEAAVISYLEYPVIDAWKNLFVVNRTYTVPANSTRMIEMRSGIDVFYGVSYTSSYKDILATNQFFVDSEGIERPLFFKHVLTGPTKEVFLYVVENGNKILVDQGFVVNYDKQLVFTNYENFFDPDTGAYKLFLLVYTNDEGTDIQELLNPIPVATQATWEDINTNGCGLKSTSSVYAQEPIAGGYNYFFSFSSKWFIKPLEHGLIQPKLPVGKLSSNNWFLRFTNGELNTAASGSSRRYWIPEYSRQPFSPYMPFVYSPFDNLLKVNNYVIKTTRENLAIDPDAGLHLEIRIYDYENNLIKLYTTDVAKANIRYGDTDIFWEADKIVSWDNEGGFVALATKLHSSWNFTASYYYEAKDYEYNLINLNPITNYVMKNHFVVYYIIPDVIATDRSIHHLIVDDDGNIVYTSQSVGATYPNLQPLDSNGVYNPNTIVGLPYRASVGNNFIDLYTVEGGVGAYMVLAEVSFRETSLPHHVFDVDLRTKGGCPAENVFDSAVIANPKILQSEFGYGSDGQEVPENGVMVIEADIGLLEPYGGNLTQQQAEALLTKHIDAAVHLSIHWVYPVVDISGYSTDVDENTITYSWEGPDDTYTVYRRSSSLASWTIVDTVVTPAEGTQSYIDSAVIGGQTYDYAVSVTRDGIEYPVSDIITIMTRS